MGSASCMETVGVYLIFERSENHRKLQYTDYYCDGDSKAYESVKNMYAPSTVNKLECIGHVQKRWVFSGPGLELKTPEPRVRGRDHQATTAMSP
ncbi:uncharacterized protein TNCV_1217791 [Trichonephila clavipes]|nr:uncharacterized protein TNCV_1217791 [Trichonephila clavipes]